MATLIIDTYKIINTLKSKGFTEEQASGVKDVIEALDLEHLASKQDLRAELSEFKADLFKWMVPLMLGQAALIATLLKIFQ